MTRIRQAIVTALVAAAIGAPAAVNAQTTTMPTSKCTEITARAASRLSYLQTKLAITSSEQSAWNAYAAAVAAGAQTVAAACAGLPTPPPTDYPTRFADHLTLASAQLQANRAILPTLQALYAALTTQQQTILNGIHRSAHSAGRWKGPR